MRNLLVVIVLLWARAVFALSADAYIVQDLNGEVLLEHNADEVRSIASITKLVVAKNSAGLDQEQLITITKDDMHVGRMRTTPLKVGQSYTRHQLTELALISSDNVAALALGRAVPENFSEFATIVEPSGLNSGNQSTARQLVLMAQALWATEVAEISTHTTTEIGKRHSTNPFLTRAGWTFYLSKTGFIDASGGCLVVTTEIAQKVVTVVILGAKNTKERWADLAEIRRMLGDSDFYVPVKVTKVAQLTKRRHKHH